MYATFLEGILPVPVKIKNKHSFHPTNSSINKYLLSIFYVSGTFLSDENSEKDKTLLMWFVF